MFKPKIFTIAGDYSKEQFIADFLAACIVTILAISLSIAFAVSMGVSPEIGLYVSVISSFIIAVLGGTYVNVGGPSAVFIVTVVGIMATHGMEGVMISTFIAGIILVLLGVFRLGTMVKYLPYPITVGFMGGTAIVIFTTQVRGFLGLNHLQNVPSNFFARWGTYLQNIGQSDLITVAIGVLGLVILIAWPRITRRIPGGLIALVVTTFVVEFFQLPVRTIGSQFTDLSLSLPSIELPTLDVDLVLTFLPSAITIAFLCIVSSLLTAVASDTIIGKKHCSNTELIAQGVTNILCGLWGFLPAAGVTTRTVANIESGGRTPISTLIHSILLLLFLIFMLPLMRLIPMVTLASMLMVASYGMSGWRSIAQLLKAPKSDVVVMLVTFFLTILVDLSVAVVVGFALAIIFRISILGKKMNVEGEEKIVLSKKYPNEVNVYRVSGPLFFGDSTKFLDSIVIPEQSKVIILRMSRVFVMDATAIQTLGILHDKCKRHNTRLILSEIADNPFSTMRKMNIIKKLGKENLHKDFDKTIQVVTSYMEQFHSQDVKDVR